MPSGGGWILEASGREVTADSIDSVSVATKEDNDSTSIIVLENLLLLVSSHTEITFSLKCPVGNIFSNQLNRKFYPITKHSASSKIPST